MKFGIKALAGVFIAVTAALSAFSNVYGADLTIGSSGDKVELVQFVLKQAGYYNLDSVTGYYGNITARAVKTFQRSYGLLPSGDVNDDTFSGIKQYMEGLPAAKRAYAGRLMSRLAGVPADAPEAGKTGALDWWGTAQYAFPLNATALVIDVGTGKSFHITRTFGHNHADCETPSREDTDIMTGIWGGYSWNRRPVVVIVDSYVMAASLTFSPHCGVDAAPVLSNVSSRSGGYGAGQNLDAIKGNGMDGHVCMHFLNSLNHDTNKLNTEHQNAVAKAAAYIAQNYGYIVQNYTERPVTAEPIASLRSVLGNANYALNIARKMPD